MSQPQKHLVVNHLNIDWDERLQLWCVSDPKGRLLARFEDHYAAVHYASQNRDFIGLNSPKVKAVHKHRIRGGQGSDLLSFIFLTGLPKPVLGCISMVVLLATCAIGAPFTFEVITLQTTVNPQFSATLAEVVALFGLSLLAVFVAMTVLLVLIRQFVPDVATDILLMFTMTATTLSLRLGLVVAIGALILGVLNIAGFSVIGSLLFSILWFIALFLVHRGLWNLAEHIA